MSKKVFLIIDKLTGGGAERVVSNLSLYLSPEVEKEIILYGQNSKVDYNFSGKIRYLDKKLPSNPFSKLFTFLKRIHTLRLIKKENSKAVFISFLEYPNLLNILSGKNNKTIVSVRNFMSKKHNKGLKAKFWNFTIRKYYKCAKYIIVVSEQMKKDMIINYNIPKEKLRLIYNSYPIEHIGNLANEELSEGEQNIFKKPVIITAGRLDEQKGHHHLLRAFKIVLESIPNAQLVILGEGKLEFHLKSLAEELNIDKNVHFLGFQKNPFKYIAKSKVFVMTSYYEGFPNALAEAMACKVPVISTDCPSGPREILIKGKITDPVKYGFCKNNFGILVPPFNGKNDSEVESKIASSIIKIITNNENYNFFSDQAFKRINEFDINKVIKEWEKVINET